MTVFKNIAFGLSVLPRSERPSSKVIREKVLRLLELMQLEEDSRAQCGDVQQRAQQKVTLVDQKIAELTRMRDELTRLSGCCPGDQPLSECRLMNCLAGTC